MHLPQTNLPSNSTDIRLCLLIISIVWGFDKCSLVPEYLEERFVRFEPWQKDRNKKRFVFSEGNLQIPIPTCWGKVFRKGNSLGQKMCVWISALPWAGGVVIATIFRLLWGWNEKMNIMHLVQSMIYHQWSVNSSYNSRANGHQKDCLNILIQLLIPYQGPAN